MNSDARRAIPSASPAGAEVPGLEGELRAYRADLIVEDELLVELKAIDRLLPVHNSQVLTYLRLSGVKQGLLINFNVPRLVNGLRSFLR
jgi:GxxExxY protein